MKRGNVRMIMVLVWSLAFALFSRSGLAGSPKMTARYATQLSKTFHLTEADYKFAQLVEEGTGGKLKIEVYPAGQLYKGRSIVKAIMEGAIEMGIIYSGAWNGQLPYIDIFDVPFAFRNMEEIHRLVTGSLGEMISADMEKYNAKLLHVGYYGRSFEIANALRPLKTPGDFKGMKIRCNLPMAVAAISALGAAPVKMSSSEVYMALQRKTIDGVVSGIQSIVKRKWTETCKYLTLTNGSYSPWLVAANKKFWDKLTPQMKQAVIDAGKKVSKMTLDRANTEDQKALRQAEKIMEVFQLQHPWKQAREAALNLWKKRTGKEKAEKILGLISSK